MRLPVQHVSHRSVPLLVCLLAFAGAGYAADRGVDLYKLEPGPYAVTTIDDLVLTDSLQGRDVTLRVLFPDGAASDGPFPVVVYSTGMMCFPQMYDRVTAHWASHGYVVILPNHLDSPNNEQKLQPSQYGILLASRVRDLSFVLDSLDEIAAGVRLEGQIDAQRVAVAGHSFGAVVSMIKTGLYIKDDYRRPWGDFYDDRFEAAVLMSAAGYGMKEMADNAFEGLRKPLMTSGGTDDRGRVPLGDLTPTEWRMQAYLLAPIRGANYALITEGTDHYMGGLICNADRGGKPDYRAVELVRAMTTTFLDAYIKDDLTARQYLQSVDVLAGVDGVARYAYR